MSFVIFQKPLTEFGLNGFILNCKLTEFVEIFFNGLVAICVTDFKA